MQLQPKAAGRTHCMRRATVAVAQLFKNSLSTQINCLRLAGPCPSSLRIASGSSSWAGQQCSSRMAEPMPKRSRLDVTGIQRSSSPTTASVAGSGDDVSTASPGRRRRKPLSPVPMEPAGHAEPVEPVQNGSSAAMAAAVTPKEPARPAAEPAQSDAAINGVTATDGSSAAAAAKLEAPPAHAAAAAAATHEAPAATHAAATAADQAHANVQQSPRTTAPAQAAVSAQAAADANSSQTVHADVQQSPTTAAQAQAAAAVGPAAAAVTNSQPSPQQAHQQVQQQGGVQELSPEAWHQRMQQQKQQQQQTQQKQQQQGLGKKRKKNHREYLTTFHQCVKRELSYEALHVYQKMKQAGSVYVNGKLDLGICNGLLNVAVGNWQWELHQRHQHLIRQAQAEGQDTAPLQAAFEAYLAAERERAQQLQQQQQAAQRQEEGQGSVEAAAAEPEVPAGTPASMVCHIQRAATDMSVRADELHSRAGVPEPAVFDDMPAQQAPFLQLMSDVMQLLVSDLEASGITPDEQLLMGLARVAGIMGDPDKAFKYAQQVVRGPGNAIPRLRDFHPALVGYALTGQADKAGEVIDCMVEHCKPGDLTEAEFALWLEAIAAGGTYEQLCRVLRMVGYELNHLKPRTLALVQRFFESDRAAAALTASAGAAAQEGTSRWQTQWVVNDPTGHVAEAGASLSLVDLTDSDWQLFDEQIFKLGSKGESSPGAFKAFQAWLDANGPFDLTLDGANIAFFGENYAEGGFKPWKIKVAYDHLQALYPQAKILLILHQSRVWQTQKDHKQTAAWLKQLEEFKLLYSTPRDMNDDMFWMYATIRFRSAARLVSHDQMRDHVWSMLRPKHMLKWRQRHVIDFYFSFNKDTFYPQEPRPYTPCVQEVRPGVWLLPSSEGASEDGQDRWLLCQPQPV